ncbi:hypothetical protein BKA69DRAFT_1090274 [Paraphysoderma sedebokerense]|nr:hypothetical protein BKA69DRAFT_1090274 [Paraphysoderma sedebokerense]
MSYNTIEPAVIDDELLQKAINDQANGEVAEIAKSEGIELSEVTSLRLDYKNVLKIDNLWAFENLTKLQLDNNIIEKIENLGHLKHLVWLDLSFNNISVIEGLDQLTKLTDLSLFNNRITKLENMEALVNLNVFSIGNNGLDNLEDLGYLSQFSNLRCVNISGNPVCKHPNYKLFILARNKNLSYLDYRLVEPDMVKEARDHFGADIAALKEQEESIQKKKAELEQQKSSSKLYTDAHIPDIDRLFQNMFSQDNEFRKLQSLSKDAVTEIIENYRARFEIILNELKHAILKQHHLRSDEYSFFKQCIGDAKDEVDSLGIRQINQFMHEKKLKLHIIRTSRIPGEVDATIKSLKSITQELRDTLIGQELKISEQFEELIKEFERNYTDLCHGVTEYSQTCFTKMRELENEYHEKFIEAVMTAFDKLSKMETDELNEEVKDLLQDKDMVSNMLTTSHEFRLSKLDQQEEQLQTGIAKHLESMIQQVQQEEIKRNRERVIEVLSFIGRCNSEIETEEESS